MATETNKTPRRDMIAQFSVFTPNRLGRLHELVKLLATENVHVLGLMVVDTTDSAIIRVVLDDPEVARKLLVSGNFNFTENSVVAVEVTPTELVRMMAVLLQAEINVNYMYSFIPQPGGKSVVALSMEDNELAEQALQRNQFRTLRQSDISR